MTKNSEIIAGLCSENASMEGTPVTRVSLTKMATPL
jgi:hypothetical protein